MPVCVLVLSERDAAENLVASLREAGTHLLRVALVAPDDEPASSGELTAERIDEVDLLNPSLTRTKRQRSMSRWLMPFGFLAGATFTQITTLDTFARFGTLGEMVLGGLLGLGSGLMGSYAAAASVPSDNEDGVRILRNRHKENAWLLLLETRPGVELPWTLVQKVRPQQVVRLSDV
ncbi:hypothetical protein [Synechococcus sp. CS-197]|uniref:hypothetical protein n=1 Tax=Synechococcus sp. CS-197 TaxID=2847985 RepID=UPI000152552A|nr:hypothetical protein [Synechococcus sp. CS-197]MCT0251238.1 hypothetical protein [Synechococcus sp. CS-197]CAK24408.1 Conserved hypothetical membrane protein specific to cyanobacteria [Synechococcus sp. WH 7803]